MTGITKAKSKENTFLDSDHFSMTSEYREAIVVLEKFEKYELQENLAYYKTHWLLSNDDFKMSIKSPSGICKNMPTIATDPLIFLYPCEDNVNRLDYREIYQLIRELTLGIYGSNQVPGIELEANYDRSTECQLPPAYINTRIGQHLINVDYMLKGLWHGVFFPNDKRQKWNERWKNNLGVNYHGIAETKRDIFEEFLSAGMIPVSDDPDYRTAYDNFTEQLHRDNLTDPQFQELFQSKLSSLTLKINFSPSSVSRRDEIFIMKSDWMVETVIKTFAEDLDSEKSEILSRLMQHQKFIIKENLAKKKSINQSIFVLKLVSSLIPFLIGLKKRMKIPNITKLLTPILGDEIRTEKELPPLITNDNYPNILFKYAKKEYFHLHGGIQFDLDSPTLLESPKELQDEKFIEQIRQVSSEASLIAQSETTYTDQNPVRIVTDSNGKKYCLIPVFTETYYNQAPKNPNWVRAISEESIKLYQKRLPLSDNAMHEQFKRFFGLDVALKNKNIMEALKTCAKHGLVVMFQTLCRKCSVSRVSKQDELGWSLMHHAAMNDKVHLIGSLILQSQDVNVRRYNTVSETSPTPLHLAAICGSISAAACLVGCGANLKSADKSGWMPIHCAAFYNQVAILKLLIRKDLELKNIMTRNATKSTPILLASESGSLTAVKCLIELGADIKFRDFQNRGVIHMAVLSKRTHIIEYFISANIDCLPVWEIILEMLHHSDKKYIQQAVTCLEIMTKYTIKHWENILKSGLIFALVELLNKQDSLPLLNTTSSVLCNICIKKEVQNEMVKTQIVEISIKLFEFTDLLLKSQMAFILSQMCHIESCQKRFAELQGYESLAKMINEARPTGNIQVLVNGVQAIESLCRDNPDNQNLVVEKTKIVDFIMEFLSYENSKINNTLLIASSLSISSIVKCNERNQKILIDAICVSPLLKLLKYRSNVDVQVAAANALENLCIDNDKSREAFLQVESEIALITLLKVWSIEVKEQGLRSLWALAGNHLTGQRLIAERIGPSLLIELIMTKSETLQSIGCRAISALTKEVKVTQDRILKEGGIEPLVRLLRLTSSTKQVLMNTVETLGTLCIGVAHCNNFEMQTHIVLENAFKELIEIFNRPNTDVSLKIEIGFTMAALTLNHKENQKKMKEKFDFCELLQLMVNLMDKKLISRCLTSLAVFGFNNTINQYTIKQAGGLDYKLFEDFLNSDDNVDQCQAAFNMVILAKDINNNNQVTITAVSVESLSENLKSKESHIVILSASLIASLCHTRAGIPDAFVSLGTVEYLIYLLDSSYSEVRAASAVALGYLSFNGTAARIMLKECRKNFTTFNKFIDEVNKMNSKFSSEFVEAYERAAKIGLPYKYLECNGGYPIIPKSSRFRIKSSVFHQESSKSKTSVKTKRPVTAFVSRGYGNV